MEVVRSVADFTPEPHPAHLYFSGLDRLVQPSLANSSKRSAQGPTPANQGFTRLRGTHPTCQTSKIIPAKKFLQGP
jgi:hypothetical protein